MRKCVTEIYIHPNSPIVLLTSCLNCFNFRSLCIISTAILDICFLSFLSLQCSLSFSLPILLLLLQYNMTKTKKNLITRDKMISLSTAHMLPSCSRVLIYSLQSYCKSSEIKSFFLYQFKFPGLVDHNGVQ